MVKQSCGLSKLPHFVVGTPGRVSDILRQGDVKLKGVRYLVLDEADRLLSDRLSSGFGEVRRAKRAEERIDELV